MQILRDGISEALPFSIVGEIACLTTTTGWLRGCELHGWRPHQFLRIGNPNA